VTQLRRMLLLSMHNMPAQGASKLQYHGSQCLCQSRTRHGDQSSNPGGGHMRGAGPRGRTGEGCKAIWHPRKPASDTSLACLSVFSAFLRRVWSELVAAWRTAHIWPSSMAAASRCRLPPYANVCNASKFKGGCARLWRVATQAMPSNSSANAARLLCANVMFCRQPAFRGFCIRAPDCQAYLDPCSALRTHER